MATKEQLDALQSDVDAANKRAEDAELARMQAEQDHAENLSDATEKMGAAQKELADLRQLLAQESASTHVDEEPTEAVQMVGMMVNMNLTSHVPLTVPDYEVRIVQELHPEGGDSEGAQVVKEDAGVIKFASESLEPGVLFAQLVRKYERANAPNPVLAAYPGGAAELASFMGKRLVTSGRPGKVKASVQRVGGKEVK